MALEAKEFHEDSLRTHHAARLMAGALQTRLIHKRARPQGPASRQNWELPGGRRDLAASFHGEATRPDSAQKAEAHQSDVYRREAVVDGDAEACGQALALAHGPGFGDVEDTEEKEDSRAAKDGTPGEEHLG